MKPTELMRPSLRLRIQELERQLRGRETVRKEEKGSGGGDAPGPAAACAIA